MDLFSGILIIAGSIIAIIILTSVLKFNSFVSLILVSLILAILTLPVPVIVPVLKKGFGSTLESIGFIIIFGTIIGIILDQSNAAVSIARFFLSYTGQGKASRAIGITGFITGLPIFCDSGFIVLSGICRSMAKSSKTAITIMAPVLAISMYGVHCLVPPHPGATAATGIIGAPIGNIILTGSLIAIPGIIITYIFILKRKYKPSMDTDYKEPETDALTPPVFQSFLPILVPLILITMKSIFPFFTDPAVIPKLGQSIDFIGDPVIALLIGCIASVPLLLHFKAKQWTNLFELAIEKAGPILIITAAGGTFGAIIKESGIISNLGQHIANTGVSLFIPYAIAVLLKTSQGSSTIAIITTASISAPLLDNLGLSGEWGKTLVVLSMGAGSMMMSHANDSFFWVVSKFSGMTTSETLKFYSVPTIILSITCFLMVLILSLFFS